MSEFRNHILKSGWGNMLYDISKRFEITEHTLIGGEPESIVIWDDANYSMCYRTIPNPVRFNELTIDILRPEDQHFATGMFVYVDSKTRIILYKEVKTTDAPADTVCRFTVNDFHGADLLYINSASWYPAKIMVRGNPQKFFQR